jgi:RNA polymerase sigma factor (TIGR02999 family)
MSECIEMMEIVHRGKRSAASELLPMVYDELRQLAALKLAREKPGQTLQPTALVHEAYLRLAGKGDAEEWGGRTHFLAAAAEAMRRILIENARRKGRAKHGGGLQHVELGEVEVACRMPPEELLALNEALTQLERVDAVGAKTVQLRFFGGLTHPEIARTLGVPLSTVSRSWAFSRVWLFRKVRSLMATD